MTQKNNTGLKLAAAVTVGLLVGGFATAGYVSDDSKIDDLNMKIAELENMPASVAEIIEVEVDNGNLDLVLNNLYDNAEDNEYLELLTDDLDDDEVSKITDRIVFINEIKSLAVKAVKAELYDEVDMMDVVENSSGTITPIQLDEDELSRLRINDDDDELSVTVDDWSDKEATVEVTGTFRQKDDNFDFTANAVFENGEFDELNIVSITQQ